MLVLDIPRRCPADFEHIDLPLYHRVHLGLVTHIPLHGCLLASGKSPHLPELVLSPFDFEKWDRIWRLNVTLKDRPGLLNEVAEVLERHKAVLLAAESSATQQQGLYQLEVVMELVDDSPIKWIWYCLQARFLKDISFMDKQPRLRIQRLQSLFHAKRDFEDQKQWPEHKLPEGFSPERAEIQLRWVDADTNSNISQHVKLAAGDLTESKGQVLQLLQLVLPENVRRVLRNTVGHYEIGSRYNGGFYLRLSDTKNRFLRVVFFKSNDPSLHCRIEYLDRPGALADLTEVLKVENFNILSAYVAPASDRNKSRVELVIRSSRMEGMRSQERKEFLEQLLSRAENISDLQLMIGYPRNYTHEWPSHPIVPLRANQSRIRQRYDDWFTGLNAEFLRQQADFKSKMDPAFEPYWRLGEHLNAEFGKLTGKTAEEKLLFVSCHYTADQVETISRHAGQHGFKVVTGKNLLADSSVAGGLIEKIKSATHFIGVWSSDGAKKLGEKWWPSPWLLWEFGVAEAHGLTWRLLIQNDIEPDVWQRIAPHRQHRIFNTMNFVESLEEILAVLAMRPPRENVP